MAEFAMCSLIVIGLMVGVIGVALAMYTYHFVSTAAQQGTRFAMVRGYTWSKDTATACSTSAPPSFAMVYDCTAASADIQNYVRSLATGGINPSSVTVSTTWPGSTPDGTTATCSQTNSQGCLVKVVVSYTFNFLPVPQLSGLAMSATSEGAVLQ
jgi:Flp pilus assembly protein TadG